VGGSTKILENQIQISFAVFVKRLPTTRLFNSEELFLIVFAVEHVLNLNYKYIDCCCTTLK